MPPLPAARGGSLSAPGVLEWEGPGDGRDSGDRGTACDRVCIRRAEQVPFRVLWTGNGCLGIVQLPGQDSRLGMRIQLTQ